MHSAYDPIREAERWVEAVQVPEPTNLIVLGMGLGYHLLMLLRNKHDDIRFLFVVEQDPRLMKLALTAIDLRPLITRSGTQWLIGLEPGEIPDAIGEKRTDIILHNCRILQLDAAIRLAPRYYTAAREEIINSLNYDEVNLRTTFINQGRNQFNIFMNIPAISCGFWPCGCEGLMAGLPAIVAAAGPSLDKNIERLRDIGDRAALIIVDTAQNSFRKRGIAPHAVVTGDPTPLNFSHFESVDDLGEAFLAFHPECNRQITQKFLRHPYLLPLFDNQSALLNRLFDTENQTGQCIRAMNVGHIAFNFARLLGCDPIILTGFDFAFAKQGGRTHASDAALSRGMGAMAADGQITIEAKGDKAPLETGRMILVPGYYDDLVPTTLPFKQYIIAIEKAIAECDIEVIDATEGGARFQGTLRMPLEEALRTRLTRDGVSERWRQFRERRPPIHYEYLIATLREGRDALADSLKTAKEMQKTLQQWHELLRRGVDWPTAKREWKHFDERWTAMVSQPLFDIFLGASVHYLYFRRQRQTRPSDETPEAFLRCMTEKYTGIMEEMEGLLERFIECADLSILSLQTHHQEGR